MAQSPSSAMPALELPPNGLSAIPEPHPDSEEFVQRERHRIANELNTIPSQSAFRSDLYNTRRSAPNDHDESLNISSREGRSDETGPWQRTATPSVSDLTTVADSDGPDAHNIRRYRLSRQATHWYDPIVRFWTTQISVTIDEGSHRDHLALERTFLGYLRTSLMLTMTGVIVAQLFRIHHSANPHPQLGFFVLGIPLASTFVGLAIVVLLIGAFRFWKQQRAMIRGKVYAGGWEISSIMVLSILLCLTAFVVITAIDIDRSYN